MHNFEFNREKESKGKPVVCPVCGNDTFITWANVTVLEKFRADPEGGWSSKKAIDDMYIDEVDTQCTKCDTPLELPGAVGYRWVNDVGDLDDPDSTMD